MSEAFNRLMDAVKQARIVADQHVNKDVFIGARAPFMKALEDNGIALAKSETPSLASFMGVPIRTDARLPDGVYAIVPAGKTLVDDGVQIGAVSAEYRDSAKGFAVALTFQRKA